MRRPLVVLGGIGSAVLFLTGARAHGDARARMARHVVVVEMQCTGAQLASYRVSPDPVELVQGDEIDWVLAESSDVSSFQIQPMGIPGQPPRPWPFSDAAGPRRGGRGVPARGRAMRANAAGVYRYAVVAQCGTGDAGAEVSIDPDIIIRAR